MVVSSIAGLFAAAICAEHSETVIVIEAEGFPDQLGTDFQGLQTVRPSQDGYATPVSRRKRVMQYLGPHRE